MSDTTTPSKDPLENFPMPDLPPLLAARPPEPPPAPVPELHRIIHYTASWCGPDRAYAPVVKAAVVPPTAPSPLPEGQSPEDWRRGWAGGRTIVLEVVDVDQAEAQATKDGVLAVPTLVAKDAAGNTLGQLIGTRMEPVVRQWMGAPSVSVDP